MVKFLLLVYFVIIIPVISYSQVLYEDIGHIPTQYQIDWNKAGLTEEAQNIADHILYVTDFGAIPDNNEDDYNAIMDAINAAKDSAGITIVYFPEGTYNIRTTISMSTGYDSIIIQGAGVNTILKFKVGKNYPGFNIVGSEDSDKILIGSGLTGSDLDKGSNLLPITDVSTLNKGDWIHYYEYNYPIENKEIYSTSIGQITRIEDISGNDITILEPTSKYYSSSYGPYLKKVYPIKNVGLENFKMIRDEGSKTDENENGANINFSYAVDCWVKGIESDNTPQYHIKTNYYTHGN